MVMLIDIHQESPEPRKIEQVVQVLKKDGVVIIPTDSVYAYACRLGSSKALERMASIRKLPPKEAHFSLICGNLSQVSEYVAPLPQPIFKLMKRALPGPYTFILEASIRVPRIFGKFKKEVGIRIPDHAIPTAIVEGLGSPLVVGSVHWEGPEVEMVIDPGLVHDRLGHNVDLTVAGGLGNPEASTVIDCRKGEAELVRQGRGVLEGVL